MPQDKDVASGGRAPADADRPPVSRVGDELQERADDDPATSKADIERTEREAFESAKEKGWDKNLNDT
jgi:hypothetical protein